MNIAVALGKICQNVLDYVLSQWERITSHSIGSYLIIHCYVTIKKWIIFHPVTSPCSCLAIKFHLTLVTPWTVVHQAPLSMGFSRQEYWIELPFPSPREIPNSGIKPWSPALQAGSSPSEPPGKPFASKALCYSSLFFFLFLSICLGIYVFPFHFERNISYK